MTNPGEVKGHTPGIYVASRASIPARSAMWRQLKACGVPINSTWIFEAEEGATESMPELWARIEREISQSSALVLYAETKDFPLKGALIEVGIAIGNNTTQPDTTGKRYHAVIVGSAKNQPVSQPSSPSPAGEVAWLIAKHASDRPMWLICEWTFAWTDDANKAIRFVRREDAEQIASIFENEEVSIEEHIWG